MATIAYVINVVNNASRIFNQVAASAAALDLAMDKAQSQLDQLNKTMAASAVPATAASDALGKLTQATAAAAAVQARLQDSLAATARQGAFAAMAMAAGGDAAKASAVDMALAAAAAGPLASGFENVAVKAELAAIALRAQATAARGATAAMLAEAAATRAADAGGILGGALGTGMGPLGTWPSSPLTIVPDSVPTSWMAYARALAMASAANTTEAGTARGAGQSTLASSVLASVAYGRWFSLWGLLFGQNRQKTQLFGGALTSLGLPAFIAAASAAHIAADAILEFVAVVVPASVALAAFGALAAPTLDDIAKKMEAVFNDTTAFGRSIYPMSDEMAKLEDSVKPEVWQLFGQALVVATHGMGLLQPLAVATGRALDDLGARAAAALVSGGMAELIHNGPMYVQRIGNIVGNIFGVIGNLLKTVPGYAKYMLDVLQGVTGALEDVTSSSIVQRIIGIGLAWHGFILWVGLAATVTLYLGNALLGLIGRLAGVDAAMTLFNAEEFAGGIRLIAGALISATAGMFGFAAAEETATVSTRILAGATTILDAAWPLLAVAAVAAIGLLIWKLAQGSAATRAFVSTVQTALGAQAIGSLGTGIAAQQGSALGQIAEAQKQIRALDAALNASGMAGGNSPAIGMYQQLAAAQTTIANNKALLPALAQDTRNYGEAVKAAGGNLTLLNTAGVTSSDIIGASKNQMAQYVIEIEAAADAQKALGLGIGRSAAAQNAQTNLWLTEGLPAMNNVISAEDTLMNTITGGEQGFLAFEQTITGVSAKLGTPPGLAGAAKVAGASLTGLNAASVNLANNFYSDAVPAAQKLIDSLEQQNISTANLTTVVATEVKQMIPFIGNNAAAKSVLVDLINNALGPGTVSLQSMDKWVRSNSTSLAGMNSIVAKSTINAGVLAGVLKGDLNAQFASLELTLSGVSGPHGLLAQYTTDIMNGTTQTAAGKATRAQLISDLEKTGLNARTARQYVDSLTTSVKHIPSHNPVSFNVSGTGTWSVAELFKKGQAPIFSAAGSYISQGRAGVDDQLVLAQRGELVVPTPIVASGAVDHLKGTIPGFAQGGVVGSYNGTAPGVGNFSTSEYDKTGQAIQASVAAAITGALSAASSFGGSPYGATSGGANAALARRMYPPWGQGAEWAAWNYVGMRESGWNAYAANPTSDARGIAQNIAGWGPSYQPGNAAQQILWMIRYIKQRYGDPIAAAAHERGMNWYGSGLAGGIFSSPTMIGVGESGPERVDITPVSGGGGGATMSQLLSVLTDIRDGIDDLIDAVTGSPGGTSPGAALAGAGGRLSGYKAMFNTRG